MKIIIIPTIREIFKNQFELSVDQRLLKFLKKNFSKSKIDIVKIGDPIDKFDLLVLAGGNDLPRIVKKKKNKIRAYLDDHYFKIAAKRKKKILGICYGSQFIVNKFKGEIVKKKKLKKNKIFTFNKKHFSLNLYHNYSIKKLPKKFLSLAETKDGMVEAFKIKNKSIYGIMWHPERNNKLNYIDKIIINDLCN